MSAPVDWSVVDANHVSLPSIVSSSDLFDGELFGDELIDIYNSTVDGHGDDGQFQMYFAVCLCQWNPLF